MYFEDYSYKIKLLDPEEVARPDIEESYLKLLKYAILSGHTEQLKDMFQGDFLVGSENQIDTLHVKNLKDVLGQIEEINDKYDGNHWVDLATVIVSAEDFIKEGKRCLAFKDRRDGGYTGLLFIGVNEDNLIKIIIQSSGHGYSFEEDHPSGPEMLWNNESVFVDDEEPVDFQDEPEPIPDHVEVDVSALHEAMAFVALREGIVDSIEQGVKVIRRGWHSEQNESVIKQAADLYEQLEYDDTFSEDAITKLAFEYIFHSAALRAFDISDEEPDFGRSHIWSSGVESCKQTLLNRGIEIKPGVKNFYLRLQIESADLEEWQGIVDWDELDKALRQMSIIAFVDAYILGAYYGQKQCDKQIVSAVLSAAHDRAAIEESCSDNTDNALEKEHIDYGEFVSKRTLVEFLFPDSVMKRCLGKAAYKEYRKNIKPFRSSKKPILMDRDTYERNCDEIKSIVKDVIISYGTSCVSRFSPEETCLTANDLEDMKEIASK